MKPETGVLLVLGGVTRNFHCQCPIKKSPFPIRFPMVMDRWKMKGSGSEISFGFEKYCQIA